PLVIALSITAMVGTGMFFGPGIAASYSGNASLLAWIFLSLVTVYVSLCFGELVSRYPSAGGVYSFAKKAYGRFSSFIIGWLTWLVGNITTSVLIVAATDYLLPGYGSLVKIGVALALILILNYIGFKGIEASTVVLVLFSIIIVGIIASIIGFGIPHINVANYSPFFTKNPFLIFVSLFFIMETFFGWESATFLGEETKNPQKVIPVSLLITTIFVAVMGILLAVTMLGVIPWQALSQSNTPVYLISGVLFGEGSRTIMGIGIFLALIGSAAGGVISSPRLLLALARDKLFIEQLSEIHPKNRTPYKAIIFQTVVSCIVVVMAFGKYLTLLSMLIPMALLMYIAVILCIPVLRKKQPDIKRYFKTPFGTAGPIIVSLFYLGVVVAWLLMTPGSWTLFKLILSFIFFGVPIYLLLTAYYDPDAIVKMSAGLARFHVLLEDFLLPKKIRKEITELFETIEKKNILEYGAGVGTLTMHLAELIGPKGKITATDLSEKNIRILKKRLEKKGFSQVKLIHDPHHISRVHPDVDSVEMIFSIGMLSYMQDANKILKEMNDLLPEDGKICFVEYVDFFRVIPNIAWLSSEKKIKEEFRKAGFAVHIKKKKGLLWNYLYIYGIKSKEEIPYI
ncbi:MAG: amino acid permease, partial [Candidatus Woesearchaeota archaeon]